MKSKLSRIAAFVMCLLLTLSVAAFALAETTGDAAAATDATQEMSPVAALLTTFLPMVLIVVVFWLFLIRPQRKKDKKIKEMLAALKVGDRVCTIGGIDFDEPIILGYSGLSDSYLKKYVEDSRDIWQGKADSLDSTLICSVIGTHTGPGVVAVAFFKKN